MDNEKGSNPLFYFEDSEDLHISNAKVHGYDQFLGGKRLKNVEVKDIEVIKSMNEQKFDEIKEQILTEIECMLSEARQGENPTKMQHLIQFISAVGSASLVEVLKSQGILPPS